MRSHAKASTTGFTQRQAAGLGHFVRGAFAIRGASRDSKGSSALATGRLAGTFAALILLFALIPTSASAITDRLQLGFSPITGSGTGVTLNFPSGIAVDETSGNVFVNDGGAANVVDIFGAEGGVPPGVASPYKLTGFLFSNEPSGAAVDNAATSPSKGTLYVVDVVHNKVKKYVRNGGTQLYEEVGELIATSPPFFEPLGAAVDSKGNVFVADYGSLSVVKFSPSGTQLARISTAATVGNPSSVAVDAAGDLFVQSYANGSVYKYPANGSGEIEPAVFTQVTPFGGTGVAVDIGANKLFVGRGDYVDQYDATTLAKQLEFGSGVLGTTTRIAVNSAADRIYVSDNGPNKRIVVFGAAVIVPTVTTNAASALTPTTATLNGTVNPDGVAVTECKFEYGTTTAYGNVKPCEGAIPTDSSDHALTGAITGLTPGATYHFRIAATNANGTNKSADATFTTPNPVTTDNATAVKGTKATLNGIVRPEGQPVTECKFEYGTTIAYGSSKPCEGAIPTDNGEHPVTAALVGLVPKTTYHFRIVATGGSGTVQSADKTFTTTAVAATDPASGVTGTKAILNGTVFPEGAPVTECKFEYGTTSALGQVKPCEGAIPADESGHAVTAALTHLAPNGTEYHFRIVTVGVSGTAQGVERTFTTTDTVVTSAATAVASTSATLNGTLNPEEIPYTECKFEYGTTSDYGSTIPCAESPASIGTGTSPVPVHADLSGLSLGTVYHFRLVGMNVDGTARGADKTLQTLGAAIKAEWAQDVLFTEATLRAQINPEGNATTYRIEWGTDSSYGNSTPEIGIGSDSTVHTIGKTLEGLTPGTTYHYRFVATNTVGENTGPDRTFATYATVVPDTDCSNQDFRTGPSASLPNCRAYEMVSPIEKNGADIVTPVNSVNVEQASDQAAIDGNKMTYSTEKPFGDTAANLWNTQFIASRGASGWSSHAITPPHHNNVSPVVGYNLTVMPGRFSAFNEDLSTGFLYDDANPPLTPEALLAPYYNNYLLNTVSGTYKTLTTQLFSPGETYLGGMGLMGYSEDGSHTLFAAHVQLTPNARPGESVQLYDYHDGELELVSILPNGEPAGSGSYSTGGTAGATYSDYYNELGETDHAISDDGSRIFWTSVQQSNPAGRIYARIDGETTVPISESVTPAANAVYWTASTDGSKVIFSAGEKLYDFDVDTEAPTLIADEVDRHRGVLGASDDVSYVYFISKEVLAGGATAGKRNLYLYHEGAKTFIATLTATDVGIGENVSGSLYGVAGNEDVTRDFSRVTPDGHHLIFQSLASLTGYDNTSLNTGEPALEIYNYDADAQQITCISCKPSGGRPETDFLVQPHFYFEKGTFDVQAAAWLPTPRRGTHIPRMVRDDGKQIFFNSYDALLPQDTNGVEDVYEWEAQGVGDCQKADGCIGLISNGENTKRSTFIDASEGGLDVFFRTSASIDPADPGLIDIYDARVGGGFPQPSGALPCVGDACQSAPEPPNDPTPASAAFRGAGDPVPSKPRKNCRARSRNAKQSKAKRKKASKRCKRNNRRAGR